MGICCLGAGLKRWGTRYRVQIVCSSKRSSRVVCFPPICGSAYQEWSLWLHCDSAAPTHFNISLLFFFFFTRCRTHSASFWISFRENYSLYSCRFGMSLVGGKLWIPLHCHQELEPLKVFYYQITQFDNKILMDYSLGYEESNCNFWSSHFT